MGLVPSYHRIFVGILLVQNFFLWVFLGSKMFSCEYFVGPNIFSHRYFVGPKCFLVDILWVQNFFSWVFCGSEIFLVGILLVNFFSCR